jgi:tetratricopeptide (TPR) repeat protein
VPNVDALMRAKIDAAVAANPTDWRIPLQIANYYANNSKQDEALSWADKSIKVKETYQNLATKAQMLYAAGRKDEAIALAGQAIERGKADKADTARLEKLLADWKAGKM